MIRVADNLQVVNPAIAGALERRDPEPIRACVKRCEAAGAQAIDINAGPCRRDPEGEITFLVRTVESATRLPLLIDTATPRAMAAGLHAAENKPILNGVSLEPRKLETILPLAADADVDLVAYLLGPDGHVLADADQRLAAAVALYNAAVDRGLDPNRLIIDPVLVPLTWQGGTAHARAVLTVMQALPDLLGFPVRTIAGLSNLTSGAPATADRGVAESAYLAMLAAAGLHMVLMNVLRQESVKTARACTALRDGHVFSWAELGGGLVK